MRQHAGQDECRRPAEFVRTVARTLVTPSSWIRMHLNSESPRATFSVGKVDPIVPTTCTCGGHEVQPLGAQIKNGLPNRSP